MPSLAPRGHRHAVARRGDPGGGAGVTKHSLFATDRRAREAQAKASHAVWIALAAWVMSGVTLAMEVMR